MPKMPCSAHPIGWAAAEPDLQLRKPLDGENRRLGSSIALLSGEQLQTKVDEHDQRDNEMRDGGDQSTDAGTDACLQRGSPMPAVN
jgi:hypothetical protein